MFTTHFYHSWLGVAFQAAGARWCHDGHDVRSRAPHRIHTVKPNYVSQACLHKMRWRAPECDQINKECVSESAQKRKAKLAARLLIASPIRCGSIQRHNMLVIHNILSELFSRAHNDTHSCWFTSARATLPVHILFRLWRFLFDFKCILQLQFAMIRMHKRRSYYYLISNAIQFIAGLSFWAILQRKKWTPNEHQLRKQKKQHKNHRTCFG